MPPAPFDQLSTRSARRAQGPLDFDLIRIASIASKEEGVALSVQHLLDCYALQQQFLTDATDRPSPRESVCMETD